MWGCRHSVSLWCVSVSTALVSLVSDASRTVPWTVTPAPTPSSIFAWSGWHAKESSHGLSGQLPLIFTLHATRFLCRQPVETKWRKHVYNFSSIFSGSLLQVFRIMQRENKSHSAGENKTFSWYLKMYTFYVACVCWLLLNTPLWCYSPLFGTSMYRTSKDSVYSSLIQVNPG